MFQEKGGEKQSAPSESGEKETSLSAAESEARYPRRFERAQDGILIFNPDSELIIDANPFLRNLLSHSHDDLVGKNL